MNKFEKFKLLSKDYGTLFAIKYYYHREMGHDEIFIQMLYDKLSKILAPVITKYQTISEIKKGERSNIIWVCWWQGYDTMPELCKICYKQLLNILPDEYKVVLITKDNYREYSNIPDYIVEKVENGTLSITQFSDILREALILNNGGTWIDASVWTNKNIFQFLEQDLRFWSVKLDAIDDPSVRGQKISECKWAGFLLSGEKNNVVCQFAFESMCLYFKEHVSTIDYFIQNLIIKIAYDQIPVIRQIIDDIPVSNKYMYELYRHMNECFDQDFWNEMCKETGAFKLTQKRMYIDSIGEEETFYGHLKSQIEY